MSERPAKKFALEGPLPQVSPHVERFRARQLLLDREVEMRLLPDGADDATRTLFLLELEDLVNLDHPAFCPVADHGVTRDRPFYVVPARAYRTLWKVHREDAPDLAARIQVARALAGAYEAAHGRGILLGPASPLTTCWDASTAELRFVHHRFPPAVKALPYPEHAPRGELLPEAWTPASEVFHWAYFAYWLLAAGKLPFESAGPAIPIRCVAAEVPRELAHVIEASLSRDPALRPGDPGEVAAVLTEAPAAPVQQIDLVASGTIPREAIAGSLERLRREGRLTERGPAPPRQTLELRAADGEVEVLGLRVDHAVRRALATLVLIAALVGGSAGMVVRTARTRARSVAVPTRGPVRRVEAAARPPALPAATLAPSTQARYKQYAGVQRMLGNEAVHPARFPSLIRQLGRLALQDKLPAALEPRERIVALRERYRADRAAACRELEEFLEELRRVLGEAGATG